MTDVFSVVMPDAPVADVVFLHGLGGDARKTWATGEAFWPDWLGQDVPGVAVWSVGYAASASGWLGRAMPIQDRAGNVLAALQNVSVGERPLIFVTHSMGGLLAKQMLRYAASSDRYKSFAAAARGVVFLATPHIGADMAKFLTRLKTVLRTTAASKDPVRNAAHLRDLNVWYRNWVHETGIGNLVFFEAYKTFGLQIVDASSADPGLAGADPIAVDADHFTICKPASRTTLAYGQVRRFVTGIRDTMPMTDQSTTPPTPPGSFNEISGSVIGPSVQAGSIQGGVHFYMHAPEVAEADEHHRPTETWADAPAVPPEIGSLLRAQVQTAQEMPYQLRGARKPSLSTVYVRQDLSTGVDEPGSEQPRLTPVLDERGQVVDLPAAPATRVVVRPPARTVREALDGTTHLLVTGGPGQGKSTMLLRLAADIATQWTTPNDRDAPLTEPVVPLRLTARTLATWLHLPSSQALAEAVHAEYGALLRTPVGADLLDNRVAGCRWLLLIDALDEVSDHAERDRLVRLLAMWGSDAAESPYRIVLTTRPIEGAALAPLQRIGAARYELQLFDMEALRRFAENWFAEDGDDGAYPFLLQIRQAHLNELVQVPLLATIAAIIFQEQRDRPLPESQYELYEAYLVYLRGTSVSGPFEKHRTALLEHLGRTSLNTETSLIAAAREWMRRNAATDYLPSGWHDDLGAFLAAVGPFVLRHNELKFLHHSFAEHLAATATARELPDRFDPDHDDFARLLHATRPKDRGQYPRSVLLHYTRLRPAEADQLVRWLHAGDSALHLLAARLLARHVAVSPEVASAFLSTVRGWAMTTQYLADEILSQASRATHYSGLAPWLADIMRDEAAPWQSRTEAATALAIRLRGDHTAEALALLRLA
ncbi:NACHT domain-containing protein, partial [Kibdelosporangium lantanae]